MKINKLKIEKLHGYIDKDISFKNEMSLLVGINGSGKTSILNVINWLLSPSLPHICVTEFELIEMTLTFEETEYIIQCKYIERTLNYSITKSGQKYHPLIIRLDALPREIRNDDVLKAKLIESYSRLSPDEKEQETWSVLTNLPSPNIIGLDRSLYTEESNTKVFYDDGIGHRLLRKKIKSTKSPTDRVKDLINLEYRKRRNSVLKLTNKLKNQLMLSTFDGNININSLVSGTRYKLTLNQIQDAEDRVNDYFTNFEKEALSKNNLKVINNYFSELKKITQEYQKDPQSETTKLLYSLNANQFIKIRKLLKEFEKFEEHSNREMIEIETYLDTINHFLTDSAKRVLFKEDTSEIAFHTLDRKGKEVTKFKDIKFLSSGEQQILILFAYVAFNSGDGKVFIIDEPELSLHVKWQEDFLEQLEKITPKSTQLILATHSPILAHKKRENSITLLPYN